MLHVEVGERLPV